MPFRPKFQKNQLIYGACCLILAGQGGLVWSLLAYQSSTPTLLGRYTPISVGLLAGMGLVFLVSAIFCLLKWRHLPKQFSSFFSWGVQKLALLESMVAGGAALILGLLSFHSLLALYFTVPVFLGSLMAIYMGLLLLVGNTIDRSQTARLGERSLLILSGLVLALSLTEVGLRLTFRSTPYRILAPGARAEFRPLPEALPGITGLSVYTTNQEGIRGDPYEPAGRYNILAIGGSTTECAYLDDHETWPYLLQTKLNSPLGRQAAIRLLWSSRSQTPVWEREEREDHNRERPLPPVWVGNVGRSGHGLVEHIHALRYFVPQYRIDAVIVMVGINDLMPALWLPEQYEAGAEDPQDFARFFHRSFYERPLVDETLPRPFPENLAIWNLGEQAWWKILIPPASSLMIEDQVGRNYLDRRRLYQQAPQKIETLPDLSAALAQYERNLITLIETARSQQIRLILTTQPAIWHDSISAEAESLLWFGYYGQSNRPSGRYSPQALARAINLFNNRLLNTCQTYQVECVDLAGQMSGDERYFYDDIHFNELGASRVAELLADELKPVLDKAQINQNHSK